MSGGLQYIAQLSPVWGMGLDVNFSHTGKADSPGIAPNGHGTTNYDAGAAFMLGRLNLETTGSNIPYLLFGIGAHTTVVNVEAEPYPGFVWSDIGGTGSRTLVNKAATNVAVALGFGIDFYQTDQFFLGFEGRFQYFGPGTYTGKQTLTTSPKVVLDGSIGQFNFFARIGRRFGHNSAPSASSILRDESAEQSKSVPPPQSKTPTDQTVRDFVLGHYSNLIEDLNAWHGPYLDSLLKMLGVKGPESLNIAMKLRQLSRQYRTDVEFADHVAELQRPMNTETAPKENPR